MRDVATVGDAVASTALADVIPRNDVDVDVEINVDHEMEVSDDAKLMVIFQVAVKEGVKGFPKTMPRLI